MSTTPCTPVPCTPVPCTPFDPCTCAPGLDKEIIFNEDSCLSADPRFLWDYTDGLLSVNGAIAASGYIGSSSQLEGAYIAPQALGTGAISFTPPSGYGGLVYRGGSVFYYWNNATNTWDSIDFAGDVVASQINIAHNGILLGAFSELNFQDNSAGVWSLDTSGNISISLSATWTSNVNANNYGITNLSSINGIPIANFLTNPLTQNINANGYSILNVGNLTTTNATVSNILTVPGEIIYQGQPLGGVIDNDLWDLNADGSISRNSNVFITGTYNTTTKRGPLTVTSQNNTNYLTIDTTGSGSDEFNAFAVAFDGVYGGELGFHINGIELWTQNTLVMQAYSDGHVYFTSHVGIGTNTPNYTLDVSGNVNALSCYSINGVPFACPGGGNTINLQNIVNINGIAVQSFAQTPWLSAINANGYALNNAGAIQSSGITVAGSINITGNYLVNGVPINTGGGGQNQTPWLSSINGANFPLYNVAGIAIGTTTPPAVPGINLQGNSGQTTIIMGDPTTTGYLAILLNSNVASAQISCWGSASPNANTVQFNNTGGPITFATFGAERLRIAGNGNIGISNANPSYTLDVIGNINTNNCYLINGTSWACWGGSGIALSNIQTINGAPPGSGGGGGQPQTPWAQNINGGNFSLSNVNTISTNGGIAVSGNVNITGQYMINGTALQPGYWVKVASALTNPGIYFNSGPVIVNAINLNPSGMTGLAMFVDGPMDVAGPFYIGGVEINPALLATLQDRLLSIETRLALARI